MIRPLPERGTSLDHPWRGDPSTAVWCGRKLMPELETITISGFKSIAAIDKLRLNPINVLIGSNGSGKSNFIGVFDFLHAIKEGRLQDYVTRAGGADRILHFGSKNTPTMKIRISFENEINQYEISLQNTETDELVPSREMTFFWNKARGYPTPYSSGLGRVGKEAGISAAENQGIEGFVRAHLDRWRLYHFHDTGPNSPMKKTSDIDDNRFLRSDGSNLPSFLYFLQERQAQSYQLIRRTIQRVTPFFDDFVLEPQRLNPEKIRLQWRHRNSDAYFDASSLSDGTLRFIALSTLFLQPESYRPSVILVDEPELGLHPYAITMLASLIKLAATDTQAIVSTQSALLLDQFEPEDVLVANRVDGGTQFTRLTSEKLNSWLETYSLGQLWEKNEFGGRPAAE
jgi:predicted ATPase